MVEPNKGTFPTHAKSNRRLGLLKAAIFLLRTQQLRLFPSCVFAISSCSLCSQVSKEESWKVIYWFLNALAQKWHISHVHSSLNRTRYIVIFNFKGPGRSGGAHGYAESSKCLSQIVNLTRSDSVHGFVLSTLCAWFNLIYETSSIFICIWSCETEG